jgi:chromosomal replication initiator protein
MTFSPEVWDGVLHSLSGELPASTVDAWLRPLVAVSSAGGNPEQPELQLLCPTTFHRDRVRDHFLSRIVECVSAAVGQRVPVRLELAESRPASLLRVNGHQKATRKSELPVAIQPTAASTPPPTAATTAKRPRLTAPQQSFDTFVTGPCNALAREASLAIAREQQLSLNQLYLSSATGLGKTHLARSVVTETRRLGTGNVLYSSAESFTSEFMNAIRTKQMPAFKRRFRRSCRVLVVEDVDFFDGKAQTQLEFFHTVKHVLDAGGRVLLTGNRLPRTLSGLDEQLRNQLASGFVAEIEPPNAQVRRDILRAKAAGGGVRLPPDCLNLLVDEVRGSVRDLEGVLIQLVTTASLMKRPIDRDLTREAVEKKCGKLTRSFCKPDPGTVIRVVASFFKATPEALASRSRRRDVLVPRQLAMYLCRRYTDASMSEIGHCLGRDHPAVKNAVARVEREILERAPLRYQVEALIERLEQLSREPGSASDDPGAQ